ncbi:MAG: methylenetetrahydrofolate reductase [Steroidobacteraceae bacterium]|nr:methylenetetrahydrofolate reductase [Steroidobacteraceae bacterium]
MTPPLRAGLTAPQWGALAHAVRETYMEVFPSPSIEQRLAVLEPGSWVAVTCSPTKGVGPTLELCARLAARGFRLVPHVAARMVRDRAHLGEILRRITDLGIDSIFVPGGDAPRPLGSYSRALELLRDIADHDHRLLHVGVAAHPEGHPAADGETLMRELLAKQAYANYLVTQMCFDAAKLIGWLREVRARGITLAAWLGLPGVFDRSALLAASLRIGVGASLRQLRHRGGVIGRLLGPRSYRPDALLYGIAPTLGDATLGVAGFHLFCFNAVAQSEDWRRRFIAGCQSQRTGAAP